MSERRNQHPPDEGRDDFVREQPRHRRLDDFDANGPMLTDEDERILDGIWEQIRIEREQKKAMSPD